VAELGIDVLIAVGDGDPAAMARAAAGAAVAVHTAGDVAGAVRVAAELIAPGDVVFVKASSEYGLGACARALASR
jgi:UDP-N-acetylmuramoyl-tripeptide--D-alanyl-D-alanine ligase